MKKIAIFISLFLFVSGIQAQQKNSVVGVIKDSVTNAIVEFAGITNIDKKITVISNTKGIFKVDVAKNNLLTIAAVGYNFDTTRITNNLIALDTIVIFLHPLSKRLPDVTVTSKTRFSQYQLDSIERRKEFFINKNVIKLPVVSLANSGIGMGINLDHFYAREKKKRNALDLFYFMENESYTNYRFTSEIISKYTSLTGEKLVAFMQLHRPTYNWLRAHTNEEDLLYYINDKLKTFNKKL